MAFAATSEIDLHALIVQQLTDALVVESNVAEVRRFQGLCPPIPTGSSPEVSFDNRSIRAIIAYADYTIRRPFGGSESASPQLLEYLESSIHGLYDVALMDGEIPAALLVRHLTHALVYLWHTDSTQAPEIAKRLIALLNSFPTLFAQGEPDRISAVIFPIFLSFSEALSSCTILPLTNLLDLAQSLLSPDITTSIRAALVHTQTHNPSLHRITASSAYAHLISPFSMPEAYTRLVEAHLIHLLGATASADPLTAESEKALWNRLLEKYTISFPALATPIPPTVGEEDQRALRGLFVLSRSMSTQALASPDLAEGGDLLSRSLRNMAMCSILLRLPDPTVLDLIEQTITRTLTSPGPSSALTLHRSMDAISLVCLCFEAERRKVLETLRTFLTQPPPLPKHVAPSSTAIHHHYGILIKTYARFCRVLHELRGEEWALGTINFLVSRLYEWQEGVGDPEEQLVGVAVVRAVGASAIAIGAEAVLSHAIAVLSRRLGSPPSATLDKTIFRELVGLATSPSTTPRVLNDVQQILTHVGKQPSTATNRTLTGAALSAQHLLASSIPSMSPRMRASCIQGLLELFVEKGLLLQRQAQSAAQLGTLAPELGVLLPVLATALAPAQASATTSTTTLAPIEDAQLGGRSVQLWRNVWLLCVRFGLCDELVYGKEWSSSLTTLAASTPLLLGPEEQAGELERILKFGTVLRSTTNGLSPTPTPLGPSASTGGSGIAAAVASVGAVALPDLPIPSASPIPLDGMGEMLLKIIPSAKGLEPSTAGYLMAIWYAECGRARVGEPLLMAQYLARLGSGGWKGSAALEQMADLITGVYVDACVLRKEPEDACSLAQLEAWVLESVGGGAASANMSAGSGVEGVVSAWSRRSADRIIRPLPLLVSRPSFLHLGFGLVQALWRSCESDRISEYRPQYTFPVVPGVYITLPDDYKLRRSLHTQLSQDMPRWILSAYSLTPADTAQALQQYLMESEGSLVSESSTRSADRATGTARNDAEGDDDDENDEDEESDGDGVHMGRSLAMRIGRTTRDLHNVSAPGGSAAFLDGFGGQQLWLGRMLCTTRKEERIHLGSSIRDTLIRYRKRYMEYGKGPTHPKITRALRAAATWLITEKPSSGLSGVHRAMEDEDEGMGSDSDVSVEGVGLGLGLGGPGAVSGRDGIAAAAMTDASSSLHHDLLALLCSVPASALSVPVMREATAIWAWVGAARPDLEIPLLASMGTSWSSLVRTRRGLFHKAFDPKDPMEAKMQYAPSTPARSSRTWRYMSGVLEAHGIWITHLVGRYESVRLRSEAGVRAILRMLQLAFSSPHSISHHPLAREGLFRMILLGLRILQNSPFGGDIVCEYRFRSHLYHRCFDWFSGKGGGMRGSAYSNAKRAAAELALLQEAYEAVEAEREVGGIPSSGRSDGTLPRNQPPPPHFSMSHSMSNLSQLEGTHAQRPRRGSISNPGNGARTSMDTMGASSAMGQNILPELRAAAKDMTPRRLRERLGDSLNLELRRFSRFRRLLLLLLESEMAILAVWGRPIIGEEVTGKVERGMTEDAWRTTLKYAWEVSRPLAFRLWERFPRVCGGMMGTELLELIREEPARAVGLPEAIPLLAENLATSTAYELKHLLYWAPVPPISAVAYLTPQYSSSPLLLQYAMRALGHFPVDVVFFYVPQIVQALRYDTLGYVERFILTTAKVSQLFAHQILWNMHANAYKDDDATVPDSLKPTLDRIEQGIVDGLSGEDKDFYEREFAFFKQVTGISGTMKPYIKKSKAEKKAKIDEEMKKIKVDVGVYLPSNPDGVVLGIDYNSGRPLQSHAKAPFMATFQVAREADNTEAGELQEIMYGEEGEEAGGEEGVTVDGATETDLGKGVVVRSRKQKLPTVETWLSAIFKVGDDCRQDVLALQLISLFRGIFISAGLDLYVFPYRVVATAPGCGVIDVIPNSISRDMLGREKINSLYEYFKQKYGPPESVAYQKARNNFIQSVAAYSVISYLLQFKDRHNGNIMVDAEGHIVHIDFGFILDIAPGGINFESSPFKLTTEMIEVMGGRGGGGEMQPFTWFCELCVKAYLASRPYLDQISQMVSLMLDSGLPCFKGETIKRLRSRFQPERSERAAAKFMMARIQESTENRRTVWYDAFQKATNGIPY